MKKFATLLVVLVCLTCCTICSICCFTCLNNSKNEVEYQRITLTKYNYKEYMDIEMYVTDFAVSEVDGDRIYSCVYHYETSGLNGYVFEDVKISYSSKDTNWADNTISKPSGLKAEVGKDGKSHVSYGACTKDMVVVPPTFGNTSILAIEGVTGTVLVPIEK